MDLMVKRNTENRGYIIKNREELIEVIKKYVAVFLPEDDDYAYEMFQEGNYDDLIDDLKLYQNDNINYFKAKNNNSTMIKELIEKYENINKIFMLLGEVEKLNGLNEIANKLEDFNDLFGKVDYNVYFFPKIGRRH